MNLCIKQCWLHKKYFVLRPSKLRIVSYLATYIVVMRREFRLGCCFFRARVHHWMFINDLKKSVAIRNRARQSKRAFDWPRR